MCIRDRYNISANCNNSALCFNAYPEWKTFSPTELLIYQNSCRVEKSKFLQSSNVKLDPFLRSCNFKKVQISEITVNPYLFYLYNLAWIYKTLNIRKVMHLDLQFFCHLLLTGSFPKHFVLNSSKKRSNCNSKLSKIGFLQNWNPKTQISAELTFPKSLLSCFQISNRVTSQSEVTCFSTLEENRYQKFNRKRSWKFRDYHLIKFYVFCIL